MEVSVSAPIVQSETNKAEKLPHIAGVCVNWLRKMIAPQSCPTGVYIPKILLTGVCYADTRPLARLVVPTKTGTGPIQLHFP